MPRSWTRDGFLISTDNALIPIPALSSAFESEELYWAKGMPEPAMRDMLDNSLCFGLYSPTPAPPPIADDDIAAGSGAATSDPAETLHEIATHVQPRRSEDTRPVLTPRGSDAPSFSSTPSLIGFARAITDRVTFFYLTDVYILPDWQGQGLGNWLISCVQEVVEEMPYLRRSMCLIGHGQEGRMEFYKRLMKMEPLSGKGTVLNWKGPGGTF